MICVVTAGGVLELDEHRYLRAIVTRYGGTALRINLTPRGWLEEEEYMAMRAYLTLLNHPSDEELWNLVFDESFQLFGDVIPLPDTTFPVGANDREKLRLMWMGIRREMSFIGILGSRMPIKRLLELLPRNVRPEGLIPAQFVIGNSERASGAPSARTVGDAIKVVGGRIAARYASSKPLTAFTPDDALQLEQNIRRQ